MDDQYQKLKEAEERIVYKVWYDTDPDASSSEIERFSNLELAKDFAKDLIDSGKAVRAQIKAEKQMYNVETYEWDVVATKTYDMVTDDPSGWYEYDWVREMTTSGDVAFAPQMGFRNPTSSELAALGLKKKKAMKEAEDEMNKKIPKLKVSIVKEVDNIIGKTKLSLNEFLTQFRDSKDMTSNRFVIRYMDVLDDIAKLEKSLPDDVGDLELILSALKGKRQLTAYDPFSGYDFLFGARIGVRINGVDLVYEGNMNFAFVETENLFLSDSDKAEEISDETDTFRSDRLIFPKGGIFNKGFFKTVKDAILTDKEKEQKK